MTPEISLIVCTRNRSATLEGALEAFSRQSFRGAWELVVVDNGCTDSTQSVLANWRDRLPIRCSQEPVAGKSRALNRGLAAASAALLVFTDDDVRPSRTWLESLARAARMHADADVFGGPIIPDFPAGTPSWMPESSVAELAFARFNPDIEEGLLPEIMLPMGPNTAVRSEAAKPLQFRLDLGPSSAGPFMCEDTDFVLQLRERGHRIVFVPEASVLHSIRSEMITVPYQLERAFQFGRSVFRLRKRLYQYAGTSWEARERTCLSARFQRAIRLNALYGQIYEAEQNGESMQSRTLSAMVYGLGWNGDPDMLANSARAWLRDHPRRIPAPAREHWGRA